MTLGAVEMAEPCTDEWLIRYTKASVSWMEACGVLGSTDHGHGSL